MREPTTDTKVDVRASDGSLHVEQTLTVTVTDVFENTGPEANLVASVLTVVENRSNWNAGGFLQCDRSGCRGDPDLQFDQLAGKDENNSLFTLEANGTLKTAVTFDYETNASTLFVSAFGHRTNTMHRWKETSRSH